MAAFSLHQHQYPFLHDSVLLKNNPIDTTSSGFFSQFYSSDDHRIGVHENSYLGHSPSMGSSMVDKVEISGENVTQKRKNRDFSSLNSAQSKEAKTVQGRKQRKCNVEEKKVKTDNKKEKRKVDEDEAPLGYIHVRARRGQATDSHSLAERVRRERISERMKLLQALVPGCEKVTGKALMLDEIINYVQSLQNQVEFLSMKLASLNPLIYEFGADLDAAFMAGECSPNQTFGDTITTATTTTSTFTTPPPSTNQSCFLDPSTLLHHGQMLNLLTQDNGGNLLWDVEGQKPKLMNPCGLINNNVCSFF